MRGAKIRTAITMVLFIVAANVTIAETYSAARSARLQSALRAAIGFNVATVTASSMTGQSCENYNRVDGVLAAGALKKLGEVIIRPGDLSTITMYQVTPGFLRVMSDSSVPVVGGLLMGQEAANELGTGDITYRQVSPLSNAARNVTAGAPASTVPIRRVDLSPRGNSYARSLMTLGSASAAYTECYVQLADAASNLSPQILAAGLRDTPNAQGTWLINRDTIGPSPLTGYTSRIGRWAWIPLALLTVVSIGLLNRARSVEFALYRTNGARLEELLVMSAAEYWVYGFIAAAWWPVTLLLSSDLGRGPVDYAAGGVGILSGIAYLSCTVVGCQVVSLLVMCGSPWETLRRE